MVLELELSELAVLRPIRTAVSGATMARRGDNGGVAAADNISCATPTESGAMMARQEGSEEGAADTGCLTPTASGAPARQEGGKDGTADSTSCVTPTSAASALRPATVCPPAPRKPRPAKRKRCGSPRPQPSFFPVPHDLVAVFVPRAAASPPCPPAKKIRVHAVGSSVSLNVMRS